MCEGYAWPETKLVAQYNEQVFRYSGIPEEIYSRNSYIRAARMAAMSTPNSPTHTICRLQRTAVEGGVPSPRPYNVIGYNDAFLG